MKPKCICAIDVSWHCVMQEDVGPVHAAVSKVMSQKPKTASSSSADFETTFDVDGNVETVAGLPPMDNQFV